VVSFIYLPVFRVAQRNVGRKQHKHSIKDPELKEKIKFSLYQLVFFIVRCMPAKARQGHLVIFKTDEIGDYMLVRNLLHYFKNSEKYRDYRIIFVGNGIFRSLFERYDAPVADETIWLNKKKFMQSIPYRFAFLCRIRKTGASVAINLVYSRNFRFDDVMMAVTTAADRIGMISESRLIPPFERRLTPGHIYTRTEDSGPETLFDAIRNAAFIGKLLDRGPLPWTTHIPEVDDISSFSLPDPYFVIFPGSGIKIKKWPPSHFAAVAKHLVQHYQLNPVVCGSPADAGECAAFLQEYGDTAVDLSGKTSLPQMLGVLKRAVCLISVDTGAVHMAAAVGCPVFALYNGAHYGRFAPYPKEIAPDFYPVYPDRIDEIIRTGSQTDFETIPFDLLKTITPEKMIGNIDAFFRQEKVAANLKKS
jgi:ADP-heptose:LPS heptosyltransferase